MAYLDEDILYNNVEEKYKVAKGKARNAYSDVLDTICEIPRADVVPKSEVERLSHKCDDCAGCTQWKCDCANIELEVARKIFAELDEFIVTRVCYVYGQVYDISDKYVELKKKYMREGE